MQVDSNASLLESYHTGDSSALDTILLQNRDWLWSYVRRKMGHRLRSLESSEDVVQDVLRKLIEQGPAFIPTDESQFRRLVGTIVLNRLRDRHDYMHAARRDRDRVAAGEPISRIGVAAPSVNSPSRVVGRKEEVRLLELALELLPSDDSHIIRRHRWDGASFEEIGAELEMTASAVQKRHVRSVAKLGGLIRSLEAGDLSAFPDPLESSDS
ncbi:MAG: RNA polymerase sigma factor (sigma-70 family) [Planctomycetota bacterium]|jgi:RNA polymerase sigma factor (sigma-70 family)